MLGGLGIAGSLQSNKVCDTKLKEIIQKDTINVLIDIKHKLELWRSDPPSRVQVEVWDRARVFREPLLKQHATNLNVQLASINTYD